MFSIIKSGMATAMHELAVISNNVSNANSNGFKKSLVSFSDFAGGLLPDGEELRNAVKWISSELKENPDQPIQPLVQKAIFTFDLSPKDSEFLIGFFIKCSR